MIDEDKNLATNLWAEYRNKSIDENLKDLGIKRGSSEHRKIVKNYLHIKDRLNEAEQSTNDVAKELEKIIEQGKTNKDDVFLQKLENLMTHLLKIKGSLMKIINTK